MKKSIKKYQPGGLVDSEGNPVRDGSGQPIMTGSGREEAEIEAKMAAAQKRLDADVQEKLKADKAKDDADFAAEEARSKTARAVAGAPAKKAAPKKSSVVTKEELAKSGLSLRDYMNKQRGLTRRDGSAPAAKKPSAPAKSSSADYSNEGRSASKKAVDNYSNEGRGRSAPAEKKKELGPLAAGRYSAGYAKQLDQTEQKRIARLEQERLQDAERAAKRKAEMSKFSEAMKKDPKQQELKASRDKDARMSPAERSAARGKGIKEFLGLAKGGSVRGAGIAQRGVRKCKIV